MKDQYGNSVLPQEKTLVPATARFNPQVWEAILVACEQEHYQLHDGIRHLLIEALKFRKFLGEDYAPYGLAHSTGPAKIRLLQQYANGIDLRIALSEYNVLLRVARQSGFTVEDVLSDLVTEEVTDSKTRLARMLDDGLTSEEIFSRENQARPVTKIKMTSSITPVTGDGSEQ